MISKDETQRAINKACGMNPVDKQAPIDWPTCTPQQLYLLQYYGKTQTIRARAKRELLKRSA